MFTLWIKLPINHRYLLDKKNNALNQTAFQMFEMGSPAKLRATSLALTLIITPAIQIHKIHQMIAPRH